MELDHSVADQKQDIGMCYIRDEGSKGKVNE